MAQQRTFGDWTLVDEGTDVGGYGLVQPTWINGKTGAQSLKAPDGALKAAAKGKNATQDLMWMTGGDFSRVKQLGLLPGADWNQLGEAGAAHQAAQDSDFSFKEIAVPTAAVLGAAFGLGPMMEGAFGLTGAAGAELAGGIGTEALIGGAGGDALAAGEITAGGLAAPSGFSGASLGAGGASATPGLVAPAGFSGASLGAGGASVAPGLAGAVGGGALAPGAFAAESLYPVLGGGAAAAGATGLGSASGGVSGAAGGATGSALGSALNGAATTADWLRLAGLGAGVGLGMYGSGQQADALRDIANQSRADRAPFLATANKYLTDPNAFLEGPGKSSMDAILRSLSVKGNPASMPSSLDLAADASMRNWLNATTSLGNLGLSGEDTRAMLGSQAAGADAAGLNALGYGIGQATNPPVTLDQLLRQMGKSSAPSLV